MYRLSLTEHRPEITSKVPMWEGSSKYFLLEKEFVKIGNLPVKSCIYSSVSQKSKSNLVSIDIKEMRKLGHIVEADHPSIIVDMDKYSLNSFRIKSKGAVIIYDHKLQFDKSNGVIRELFEKISPFV